MLHRSEVVLDRVRRVATMRSSGIRTVRWEYALDDFHAVTLKATKGRPAEDPTYFHVMLVRGAEHEVLNEVCRFEWDREKLFSFAQSPDVEEARRTAVRVAEFCHLPFGHPTLEPDAPDPQMLPLDLDPALWIRCPEQPTPDRAFA